jgi:uncharacterized protein YjbI with pentapeptide repeats
VAMANGQQRVKLWLQQRWQGVKGWLRRERSKKILIVAVAAVALAALTALPWPTIQRTVGSGTYKVSQIGAAAFVAVTVSVIGALVYGVAKKTLWELLELLIVPLALAGIGLWFTAQQDARQQQIEEQRAEDAAVQAYLDGMGQLLIAKDEPLRRSEEGDEVQTLARARTLTILGSLGSDLGAGPDNKRTVMAFLYEAALIDKDENVIRLDEAHLEDADLRGAVLEDARLALTHMNGADLGNADLEDAELGGVDLGGADLSGANLSNADLDSTHLKDADLTGANLADANLSGAFLQGAKGVSYKTLAEQTDDLELATMTDGTVVHDGRYVTDEFVEFDAELNAEVGLPMSFDVGKGWKRRYQMPAATGELYLESPEGGLLIFTSPLHVFDTSPLSHTRKISAPGKTEKWVKWFRNHPKLDTLKPVSRSVGHEPGKQIDVTSEIRALTSLSKPEYQPLDLCGKDDCVPLAPFPKSASYGGLVSFGEHTAETEDRFVIVKVGDKPVVIYIHAPEGKIHEFYSKEAWKLLETVKWENRGAP